MLKYFHDCRPSALKSLSWEQYEKDLLSDPDKLKLAFEKAWDARKFEIELYWKRATYFWAFIATTFIGYFALINSTIYRQPDAHDHAEVYFVICIGFVLSCAWFFINRGSKAWQRHWEVHVDLLEDKVVGPLYKTVYAKKTYSVSKINEIVSMVFVGIWILLGAKYLLDQDLLHFNPRHINWLVVVSSLFAIAAIYSMIFGHGRGRFSDRPVTMFRRHFSYTHEEPNRTEQTDAPNPHASGTSGISPAEQARMPEAGGDR